jgi:putative PIN family toxin of toxin-antitoxin system
LRCVFDTNVLISASLLPESKPRHALDLVLRNGRILISAATFAELFEVLARAKFRRYLNEQDIRTFLAALSREAEWVDVNVRIAASRDASDNKFLELAVSGRATHIVTGDIDLLVLDPFRGITICPPHSFLERAQR